MKLKYTCSLNKSYDKPRQHIKKQRHYFADQFLYSQDMAFPVVLYGCESWTIKKAEHQRIDAFELWCWRRLLRVPWKARRSNQPILKEISPECSLEWLMLKLKLQNFGHLMPRTNSSGSFQMSQLFASGGPKYWSFSLNISPSNEHPGLQKHQFFCAQLSL